MATVYIGDDNVRYVLGQSGQNNLLVIGVNPSTATPNNPDNTIRKVIKIANSNGYDGWIMVNLYPQRATNPHDMDSNGSPQLLAENLAQINSVCQKFQIKNVWCAWGNLIDIRGKNSFLHKSWNDIKNLLKGFGVKFYRCGELTTKGNPRHPLYLPLNSKLVEL